VKRRVSRSTKLRVATVLLVGLAHTKVVGQPILIDESTRAGLDAGIRTDDVGQVQFKTKSQTGAVYSVPPGQGSREVTS